MINVLIRDRKGRHGDRSESNTYKLRSTKDCQPHQKLVRKKEQILPQSPADPSVSDFGCQNYESTHVG